MKDILVVEDETNSFILVEKILLKTNSNVYNVSTGVDAINFLKDKSIDLVIMDFRLPDITGGEATIRIKEDNPEQKIIFYTAYSDIDHNKYGADDIAYKPLQDHRSFLNQVNSLLDSKKILILEDEVLNYLKISNVLTDYYINWAKNGEEGLEYLKKKEYDLIIADLEMPVMDGIEFINEFKKNQANTPILTYSTSEKVDQAINLGAIGKLPKPINNREERTKLIKTIQKYI